MAGMHRGKSGVDRVERPRPSAFAQYRALLAKDVRQEFRTREMLTSMIVYSLLVLTIYGAALAQVGDKLQVVSFAGGLLWALIVFTSLLGLNRSFSHETESGCLEGILLAPIDRAVVFLAKATSNLLFLLMVELVTVPLFFVFFLSGAELPPTTPMILLPLWSVRSAWRGSVRCCPPWRLTRAAATCCSRFCLSPWHFHCCTLASPRPVLR
ncbi:MAG: heme exporter protein CcmB [Collinsella intestinalis]